MKIKTILKNAHNRPKRALIMTKNGGGGGGARCGRVGGGERRSVREAERKIEKQRVGSLASLTAGILHRLTSSGLPNVCCSGHDLELVNHLKRNTYSEKEIGVIF